MQTWNLEGVHRDHARCRCVVWRCLGNGGSLNAGLRLGRDVDARCQAASVASIQREVERTKKVIVGNVMTELSILSNRIRPHRGKP